MNNMNIELSAKNFSGDAFRITGLKANSTLDYLISKVYEKYNNVDKKNLILIHNGMPHFYQPGSPTLQATLQSLNISNKQTIFVVVRLIGG